MLRTARLVEAGRQQCELAARRILMEVEAILGEAMSYLSQYWVTVCPGRAD
jgi:hypothetical protein